MTKAKVYRADLYGLREGKYRYLWENDVSTTEWTEVKPSSPFYLFAVQEEALLEEYQQGWKLTEIMPVNVLGFQTHRDNFAVAFEKAEIESRIRDLRDPALSDGQLRQKYGLRDNRDWQLAAARKALQADPQWCEAITLCSYRPFDDRWCYFSESVMDYPRRELLDNVVHRENLCLNIVRQTKMAFWNHAVVTDKPAPAVFVEIKDGSSVFPLYLYPTNSLFDTGARRPNLEPAFVAELAERVGLEFIPDGKGNLTRTFGPEDVFHYLYAVFHAPGYRTCYAEFLKIDFPRVPLTSDLELFRALVAKGGALVALHLMECPGGSMAEGNPRGITSYPVEGDNVVEKVGFVPDQGGETGRVTINKTQYFDGVPTEVWNFHVGGYQVCQKWLKDRKGRTLGYDDLQHYAGIVAALRETIGIMDEIDEAIAAHGGWPLG